MRILMDWLAEFTDVPDKVQHLADRITDIGLEVEEIVRLDRQISKVDVATVTHTETHPEQTQLTVCELESDHGDARIVTAAPGVREQAKYLWARPGATLPGQTVESRDFRGIESEGMLVSSRELGLTQEAQTLLAIPEQYDNGQTAVDVLELEEPILELDLTPNRPDCLSHLGVARDFAAAEGLQLTDPRPRTLPDGTDTDVKINIEAPEDCWSYTGVPVAGVNVQPSPFERKKRLLKMGLRPLNNIVDITNYTLFEVGHPLHPFDYDRIVSPVTIRRAQDGETIHTLDGESRELKAEDLVIADRHGPQALAGIMGGTNAQVEPRTDRILLEGAYFNPTTIRSTAGRLKIHTEASHRFERGCDPVDYTRAIARCLELMSEDPAQDDEFTIFDPVSVVEHEPETTQISFAPETCKHSIGFHPGKETMKTQLSRLGLTINNQGSQWELTVPSWRRDLSRSADILEEIVRLHGFEKIPTSFPSLSLKQSVRYEPSVSDRIRHFLSARGLYETITYSFVGEEEHHFTDASTPRTLENPLSRHTKTMRTEILSSLLDVWKKNKDEDAQGFFELGPIFPENEHEKTVLGMVLGGKRDPRRWDNPQVLDFHSASGLIEALIEYLGVGEVQLQPADQNGFHPERCATIHLSNDPIGIVGQVKSTLTEHADHPILAGSIDLDPLDIDLNREYESYSSQPVVKRDLDLVIDRDQHVQPLRDTIQDQAKWLESIRIFDIYQGDPLPDGKKSVSFQFSFRHPEKTLDDETVNKIQDDIFQALQTQFGATLRSG